MKHIKFNTAPDKQTTVMLRHQVESHLANEVARLLNRSDSEGLHWQGSVTDLMEALHVAYTTGIITTQEGLIAPFHDIVRQACQVLHIKEPHNPYECAARGSRRKCMRNSPYMSRYTRRLSDDPQAEPLWDMISGN